MAIIKKDVNAPLDDLVKRNEPQGEPVTEVEAVKQRRIRRSGLVQAAMESPGVAAYSTNWDDYKKKVKELAEESLHWVES